MLKSKLFMSIAALAVLALFGCDSSSSTDATSENNPAVTSDTQTQKEIKDSVRVVKSSDAVVDNPSTDNPVMQNTTSSNLVSCEMQTADIFGNRFCIEADVAYADSVKMLCSTDNEDYEGALASAVLGSGCPTGAVKVCAMKSKDGNDSAQTYYYSSMFKSMSCEELVEDEVVVDVTPSGQDSESKDSYDPNGKTIACSFGPICTQALADMFDASECDGELLNACPAGGEKCDLSSLGGDIEGAAMYAYEGITCEMLFQAGEWEF